MVVFIFYIVIALLVVVPIKMGKIMTKMHINNLHTDGDKEINRYTLPIKNTYEKSYVKVEIIQRDIKKGDFMDDTYYRLKYYISDKLQIAYDLNHYEMAKDRLFTSSILEERTLDYNTSKILAGKDSKYMDTYMDISYLTIYKPVEMYENTNKIVSRYKKLVKDEFSDV